MTAPEPGPLQRVLAELATRYPAEDQMVPDLDRIRLPCELLGNPQKSCPAIHLTGTNGKSSTARMVDALLQAFGLRPGRFTSPHLDSVTERITLDGQPELPLHPLDVTAKPPNDATASTCLGLIQTAGGQLDTSPTLDDMILGVPFLRNTYTVMAFDQPESNGSFPPNSADVNRVESVRPRLGLLNLTDPVIAADEFHQVRVLKQPLGNTGLLIPPRD